MSTHAVPELESGSAAAPVKRSFYYSTVGQAIVIGIVSFFSIGLYNALGGLGAGGLASATAWNNATALLFAFLCVTCIFAPIIINQFPLRYSLALSSCTYTIYAASLYCNSRNGNEWFLVLANAINGIGAGVMFAVEGAVVVGYPEQSARGRFISSWVFMRNLGPVVGGAILLAVNIRTDGAGSVSLSSFAIFVGLMCAAPFFALLLASPEKVQRKDGTRVVLHKTSWKAELKQTKRFLTNRRVLLLLPIFFTSWWADSFISTYNSTYYTVRVRAMSSLVTPFAGNIGSLATGAFLDSKLLTRRGRALAALGFFFLFNLATWAYSAANIAHCEGLETAPRFDWSHGGFGGAYVLTFLTNMEELGVQSFLYFLIGTLTDDMQELVHLTGILRGIEGAGQAVSYGISGSSASRWVSIGLGFGLVAVSYPLAYLAIRDIPENAAVAAVKAEKAGEESAEEKELA
ncbi:hypothetical protein JCM10450v2_004974 [Rhodotorula kratochvilovae]